VHGSLCISIENVRKAISSCRDYMGKIWVYNTSISVVFRLSCYNKFSQTGWFINYKIIFYFSTRPMFENMKPEVLGSGETFLLETADY
jgi:hypothetical protein